MSIRKKLLDEINLEIDAQAEALQAAGFSVESLKLANEALIDSFLGIPRQFPNEKRAVEHFVNKLERIL